MNPLDLLPTTWPGAAVGLAVVFLLAIPLSLALQAHRAAVAKQEARILEILRRKPASSLAIAEELGASVSSVWYRLHRMELQGKVTAKRGVVHYPERGNRPRWIYRVVESGASS